MISYYDLILTHTYIQNPIIIPAVKKRSRTKPHYHTCCKEEEQSKTVEDPHTWSTCPCLWGKMNPKTVTLPLRTKWTLFLLGPDSMNKWSNIQHWDIMAKYHYNRRRMPISTTTEGGCLMEKEDVPLCTDNSQSPLPLPAPEDKKKTLKQKEP